MTGSDPKFLQAATAEGARTGRTAEQVLQDDLTRLERAEYPTAECPDAGAFASSLDEPLSPDILEHVKTCRPCHSLAVVYGRIPKQ